MNKYLYFAVSATDQYIVPLSRLLGADDTGSSKVVLHFEDLNGSTAKNGDITKVVLSVNAGKEKEALRDLFEGIANFRGEVITVADSDNSSFFGVNITACDSITHDQTSASSGLTLGGDLTIPAAQDVDLVDNAASALSFDATGKLGIIDIVTTDGSEGVTMSGTLGVTGAATFAAGAQSSAVAVVATADGSGTGTIPSGTAFALVASADANNIVVLPAPTIGNIVHIFAISAFELRSNDPTSVAINGGTASGAESEVGAGVLVKCVCTSTTTWVANTFAADGTEAALQVAGA